MESSQITNLKFGSVKVFKILAFLALFRLELTSQSPGLLNLYDSLYLSFSLDRFECNKNANGKLLANLIFHGLQKSLREISNNLEKEVRFLFQLKFALVLWKISGPLWFSSSSLIRNNNLYHSANRSKALCS